MESYSKIARETLPKIIIPYISISAVLDGISASDSEKLLIKPIENAVKSVNGIKQITSIAHDNMAIVILEFYMSADIKTALNDVRAKLDNAKSKMPLELQSLTASEADISTKIPILGVSIVSDDASEYFMSTLAEELKSSIKDIKSVYDVDIIGKRDYVAEVIVEPEILETYGIDLQQVAGFIRSNNAIIKTGKLRSDHGTFSVEVSGIINSIKDILDIPVITNPEQTSVVTIGEIAQGKLTFKEAEQLVRVNGKKAIVLFVSKVSGANLIPTIAKIKSTVNILKNNLPSNIEIVYSNDDGEFIEDSLQNLNNNVILAVALVTIVIFFFLNVKSSLLIALSIPTSFLSGILVINMLGFTLNIIVLFGLIMAVGILVDNAIVITEYADRQMMAGKDKYTAYKQAVIMMQYPMISSTVTTLSAFIPLLFWPGIMGKFMFYLPSTINIVLVASLLNSLIFLPVLGIILGSSKYKNGALEKAISLEKGHTDQLDQFRKGYAHILTKAVHKPFITVALVMCSMIGIIFLYISFNPGVEFFPNVEPDSATIIVHARGNLSLSQKDEIVRSVENQILDMHNEIKVFYTTIGKIDSGFSMGNKDVIANIKLEYVNWISRRKSRAILTDIRHKLSQIPGIIIEIVEDKSGPRSSKPINIRLSSHNDEQMVDTIFIIKDAMMKVGGFKNILDNRPVPEINWEININKQKAAHFGMDLMTLGGMLQMTTDGLKLTTYNPDFSPDEVDIVLRLPEKNRNLKQLDHLKINTGKGLVPISNFIERKPMQKIRSIKRVDGYRTIELFSDLEEGTLPAKKLKELAQWLQKHKEKMHPEVKIEFVGDQEDIKETQAFMGKAFIVSIMMIVVVLIAQFNKIYDTIIVLTAAFFSTVGVMLGLLLTQRPFGVVMCGIALIALAGVVVNNNILLIDAFNINKAEGMDAKEAMVIAAVSRIRPILLTAGTTVLGLVPMITGINIDFFNFRILINPPSNQWWTQLSTALSGGLVFATIITLFFTPALIVVGEDIINNLKKIFYLHNREKSQRNRGRIKDKLKSKKNISNLSNAKDR